MAANEIGGEQGDRSLGLARHDPSEHLASSIAPQNETSHLASWSSGSSWTGSDGPSAFETCAGLFGADHGATEQCLESAPASTTANASVAAFSLHPNRCPSEIDFDEEPSVSSATDVVQAANDISAGGFAAPPEMPLTMPAGLSGGAIEDVGDTDIAAADWLDVSHALLDAGNNESGQAGQAGSR